jgi:hypothetical protein
MEKILKKWELSVYFIECYNGMIWEELLFSKKNKNKNLKK